MDNRFKIVCYNISLGAFAFILAACAPAATPKPDTASTRRVPARVAGCGRSPGRRSARW